jgi:glycosyltransferase involved in cell wall biosynthesis
MTQLSDDKPLVSIVILTKNGGELFKQSIKKIFSQKISCPFEVVVVDSSSTDGTLEFLKTYPIRLFEIKEEEFSFGTTRDYAFGKAQGRYIVTISQDVVPANEYWLEQMISPLVEDRSDVVQGEVVVPTDWNVFYWEKKGLFYFTTEREEFCKRYSEIGLSCCSLAMKHEAWLTTGFGNAVMNEDKAIQKKLIEKGFRIVRATDAVAYHGHQYTLDSLKKRCENEGLGWKCAGVRYDFSRMARDLVQKKWIYRLLFSGLIKREIKTVAEALFLFIRPIYLYKGNRFNKAYKP